MNLEGITLSEISQMQKDQYCMISLTGAENGGYQGLGGGGNEMLVVAAADVDDDDAIWLLNMMKLYK